MLYTEPRYTKDLDIWVDSTEANAQRVYRALAEFGAPLAGIAASEFAKPDLIYQLGMPPSRIDILTSISGVNIFEEAWSRRKEADFDGVPALFVSIKDLVANKRATGRESDRIDCERLEASRDL
jgi:hypothetical protein